MVRRQLQGLALLGAVLVLLLLGGGPASAHAALTGTDPADGTVLKKAPRAVTLTFSESVGLLDDSFRLFGPDGRRMDAGEARHASGRSDTARMTLPAKLRQGTYTVAWRVVSADSHPVSGAFTFSVGKPSPTQATIDTGPVENPVTGSLYDFARYVSYVAVALLVGGAAFVLVCRPPDPGVLRKPVVGGWWALLASSVVLLVLRAPYEAGTGPASVFDVSALGRTLAGRPGLALLARLVLLLPTAVFLVRLSRRPATRPPSRTTLAVGAVLAVGLALTWAASEHASAGIQVPVAMTSTVLHLLSMAVWLGGLTVLLTLLNRVTARSGAAAAVSTGGAGAGAGSAGPARGSEPADADTDTDAGVDTARGSDAADAEAADGKARSDSAADEHEPATVTTAPARATATAIAKTTVPAKTTATVTATSATATVPATELAAAVARFSRVALTAVTVLVITGVYQSWRGLGSWSALTDTTYGRLLVAKLVAVGLLLAAASLSRRWTARLVTADAEAAVWTPPASAHAKAKAPVAEQPEAETPSHPVAPDAYHHALRRSVLTEVAVGVAVLVVTTVLTTTLPGRAAAEAAQAPAAGGPSTSVTMIPFDIGTPGAHGKVQITLEPARVGDNSVEAVVFGPDGGITTVPELRLTFTLPAQKIGPIDAKLTDQGGYWGTDTVNLPIPGTWTMNATVRVSELDQVTESKTVQIQR